MNCSKRQICDYILNETDYYLHLADIAKDADKRNYVVSYDKILTTGFNTTITLKKGIKELVDGISVINFDNKYSNI